MKELIFRIDVSTEVDIDEEDGPYALLSLESGLDVDNREHTYFVDNIIVYDIYCNPTEHDFSPSITYTSLSLYENTAA